jgi:hypothetical protein
MELTNKHLEMLFEMSDIHFEWFQLYSPKSNITYVDVLKLNHKKMADLSKACLDCTEEMLDLIFQKIINDYKRMLQNEKFKN